MSTEKNYVTATELAEILGVSIGQAYKIIRPLINDFLRKMAKFRHQENQDVRPEQG